MVGSEGTCARGRPLFTAELPFYEISTHIPLLFSLKAEENRAGGTASPLANVLDFHPSYVSGSRDDRHHHALRAFILLLSSKQPVPLFLGKSVPLLRLTRRPFYALPLILPGNCPLHTHP